MPFLTTEEGGVSCRRREGKKATLPAIPKPTPPPNKTKKKTPHPKKGKAGKVAGQTPREGERGERGKLRGRRGRDRLSLEEGEELNLSNVKKESKKGIFGEVQEGSPLRKKCGS